MMDVKHVLVDLAKDRNGVAGVGTKHRGDLIRDWLFERELGTRKHADSHRTIGASSAKRQTWRGSRFGETCTSMPVGTARGEVQHLTDYYGFVIALTASECAICATSSDG